MIKSIVNMLAGIRQSRYPVEFRISPSVWPVDLADLVEQLRAIALQPQGEAAAPGDTALSKEQMLFFAEVGTGLWRLRQKMIKPGTDRPLEEMQRAFRHLESTWDVLIQAGLEIQDHTGAAYDGGMSLKVVVFQPTEGIGREKIAETIKPTIYYKGQSIQMGEVIVAVPEGKATQ